jgi:hypothetical protein
MGGRIWGKWEQGKMEKKMGRKRDLVIQDRIEGGERKERVSRKEGVEGKGTGEEGTVPVNPKSFSTCHQMLSKQWEEDNCKIKESFTLESSGN